MITFTNDIMAIVKGIQRLVRAEFPTTPIVFAEEYDPKIFQEGNQVIVLWLDDEDHAGNFTNGEDKIYHFRLEYYIKDSTRIDLRSLEKNFTDFSQRLDRLLNNNKAYRYNNDTIWHTLNISGSSFPYSVLNEEGDIIPGLKLINRELEIYRGNHFA